MKIRAQVTEVSFGDERFGTERVSYRAVSLDGRRVFQSLSSVEKMPQLGDVLIYTLSEEGRIIGAPEPEAPILSEQKFNEWIEQRMGLENFLGEPPMTQLLVRDAFMAGRAEVRPDTFLTAEEFTKGYQP